MIAFPSGWVGATVGEILEFKYGRGLPEKLRKPGSYRVFGSNGVVGYHDKALTAPPSIIVGRKGSIGEVHYSEEPCYPIDTTYYVDHFECGEPRFILHLLKNLQLQNLNRATAVPGLNRDDAYALEIGLPPRVEQRRIAAKIDSLSAKSKRARNHLDHIPRLVEKYKQAILAAAFRGNLTREWRVNHFERVPVKPRGQQIKNGRVAPDDDFVAPYDIPDGWTWLLLPQIGEIDRGRSRHRPRNDPRLFGGRYPFIQTGEVRAANRFLASFTETYSDFGLSQSRLWPKGTVCITIAANIAETAILAIDACFPDSIVGFTADNERTMPSYVEFFLRTARDELTAFAPATAQKNINLDTLSRIRLPIAPLDEQREIVARIEKAFSWIDRLASETTNARKLIDHLDQAVLAKAFRGELVPQDQSDEPASVLLERIRAERQTATPPRGRQQHPKAGPAHRRTRGGH